MEERCAGSCTRYHEYYFFISISFIPHLYHVKPLTPSDEKSEEEGGGGGGGVSRMTRMMDPLVLCTKELSDPSKRSRTTTTGSSWRDHPYLRDTIHYPLNGSSIRVMPCTIKKRKVKNAAVISKPLI
jgi:hypothetical protein